MIVTEIVDDHKVSDQEGSYLSLQHSSFEVLRELLDRQYDLLENDKSLNVIQQEWLREDIEVVEDELAYRWETGKE